MGLLSLIFHTKRTSIGQKAIAGVAGESVVAITFDATLKHSHRATSDVTHVPVEGNARVADHSRPLPVEVEIDGVVSDFAIESLISFEGRGVTFAPAFTGALRRARRGDSSPGKQAWDDLIRLKDTAALVTIHTRQRNYENMMITDVSAEFGPDTGRVYPLRIALREVQIVETEEAAVDPALLRGKPTESKGKKALKPAPIKVAEQSNWDACVANRTASGDSTIDAISECGIRKINGTNEFASSGGFSGG